MASAFLQLVMLPPTSSFPPGHVGGEGSIGWRRPPGESCAENLDVIDGVCLGVEQGEAYRAPSAAANLALAPHRLRSPQIASDRLRSPQIAPLSFPCEPPPSV